MSQVPSFDGYDNVGRRFWMKVRVGDGCWEWSGAFFKKHGKRTYGCFWYGGKKELATRVAVAISGRDVPKHLMVLHSCDNPACVRPSHLRVGTAKDNMADMFARGRQPNFRGERCASSKLTSDDVLEIRARAASGEKQASIARDFRIDRSAISNVIRGRSWTHLPGAVPLSARDPQSISMDSRLDAPPSAGECAK